MSDNPENKPITVDDILEKGIPLTVPNVLDPSVISNMNSKQDLFECMHCKKLFKSKQSLNLHLANCPKRAVLRDFVVGDRIFHVWLNPRKDVVATLIRLSRHTKPDIVAKVFVGALEYLSMYGNVKYYTVYPYIPGKTPVKPIKEERMYKEYIDKAHKLWLEEDTKIKKTLKSGKKPDFMKD